jgi:hypothetical protein
MRAPQGSRDGAVRGFPPCLPGVHAPWVRQEHQTLWSFSPEKLRLGTEANLLRRKVKFTSVELTELRGAEARQSGFDR